MIMKHQGYPKDPWDKPHRYEKPKIEKPLTISEVFPNFNRWAIGFDPLIETLSQISRETKASASYPPYNLRQEEDSYVLELALAGFAKKDLKITVKESALTVEGKSKAEDDEYIHQGIAAREFSQNFALGEYVVVTGAEMVDGMLKVYLKQELPDEKKPKVIEIR